MDRSHDAVVLTPAEVRVLGALVEKELSTPDYYPMTPNALRTACNQKTNRDPVTAYTEAEIMDAVASLQRRRLAGHAAGASSRTDKYRHALAEAYGLDAPARAVLSSLLLRGPETVGELRGRTARLHAFDDLDAVQAVLEQLAEHGPPLVAELPRRPGQKETRYAHLLAGTPDVDAAPTPGAGLLEARTAALEEEVVALREELEALREELVAFREMFE